MKIIQNKIRKYYFRDGEEYNFKCKNCHKSLTIMNWENNKKCSCGVVWKIELIATGTLNENNKSL